MFPPEFEIEPTAARTDFDDKALQGAFGLLGTLGVPAWAMKGAEAASRGVVSILRKRSPKNAVKLTFFLVPPPFGPICVPEPA
jgi:hypothetical protein